MNQWCVCDRCDTPYGLPAELWPGKALCPLCDPSVPVWERHRYVRNQAAAA